jgi:histidyl-tRNA synthetase
MDTRLPTDPYKGTRDFYPEDMAIQRYIFDTWAKTAESFGYERYDASILEPSELYKSKGAENEEMVNEQTYTFIDRGEREVTLRPEMTPTVARMVAGKRRDLSFPVRWYSIPNLFRYERPQRGRLREHWQLNCDMFGADDVSADVEIISLAYHTLTSFGATPDMFEIRVNSREWLNSHLEEKGLSEEQKKAMILLLDKKDKIDNFDEEAEKIIGEKYVLPDTIEMESPLMRVINELSELGITNVTFSPSIVRGFNYYTGIVFEVYDTSGENNRAMMGGGRYDNLTQLFGGDPISGIGFGMGDVIMRDFLETRKLLPPTVGVTAPVLTVLPMDTSLNLDGEKVAQEFRHAGIRTSVDLSDKKVGKKIGNASDVGVSFIIVVGEDEAESQTFTLKNLKTSEEKTGSISELIKVILA